MEKEITISYGGINCKLGNLLANRLIPNKFVEAVGPFVFLYHVYPSMRIPATPQSAKGKFAMPHRGISTLTYVLSGEMEHFDSRGNHGISAPGQIHWMNAGSGILHEEGLTDSFQQSGGLLHVLQFWINLPSKNKKDEPEYINLQADEVTELILPDNAGKLRILIGSYGIESSVIKAFSAQFLYHIILNPKSAFNLHTRLNFEYAAFVPTDDVKVNHQFFGKSQLILFKQDKGDIELYNNNVSAVDIIVFGGKPYNEAIVAEGPFVMNNRLEICEAYQDFHMGKYGKINYPIKDY